MATDTQISEILLRYRFDTGASKAAADAAAKLLEDTKKRTLSIGDAADEMNKRFANTARNKAIDQIARQARQAAIETGSWERSTRLAELALSRAGASASEVKRVSDQIAEAARNTNLLYERYKQVKAEFASTVVPSALGGSAGGGIGDIRNGKGSLGRAGTQLYNLPDLPLAGSLSTTEVSRGLILADLAAQKFNISASAMATGLIGVTAVGAGFAIGIGEINRQLGEATEAAKKYLAAQTDLTKQILQGATSADIQEQLAAQRAERDAKQSAIDSAQTFIAEYEAILNRDFAESIAAQVDNDPSTLTSDQMLEDLSSRISEFYGGQVSGALALKGALDTYLTEVEDLNGVIAIGEQALSSMAVAANDMISATREQIERDADLAKLRRTASSEQIRDQIATNRELADAYNDANVRLRQQSDEAAQAGDVEAWTALTEEIKSNVEQIIALGVASDELQTSVLPVVEALERAKKLQEGATDANQAYLDALETEGKAREEATKAELDLAEARQNSAYKIDQIYADLDAKQLEAETARLEAIAEAEEKVGETRKENAEKAAQAIAKIERDFQQSYNDAVGSRDALAAKKATEARDKALADLEQSQTDQEDQLQKNLDKQLKTIQKNYDKQQATAEKAAAKAIQQESDRANKEFAIRQRAIDTAQVAIQNAANAQISTYQTVQQYAQLTGNATRAEFANIMQAAATGMEFVRQTIQNALMAATTQRAQAVQQYTRPIGPLQSFGPQINTSPWASLSGYGSTPYSQPPAPQSANQSIVFAPTVSGATRQQVRKDLGRLLDRFVEMV